MDDADPDATLDQPPGAASSGAATGATRADGPAAPSRAGGTARAEAPAAPAKVDSLSAPVRALEPTAPVSREEPGRYTMVREFGRGGQAVVMLARDEHIGRDVAFKRIRSDRLRAAKSAGSSTPAIRFLREARITGQLEHPGIVPVHEVGQSPDGSLYYTQKLVRGRTLRAALAACKSLGDRLKLLPHFSDVCNAVAYANGRGVLHRDLKPDNVMVGEFGETVVLDWGLAKVRGIDDDAGEETQQPESAGLTRAGSAIGTPLYMSPEQALGQVDRIDDRSEVWSLGAMLYELLTGRPPFTGKTSKEVIAQVTAAEVPRIEDPHAPPDLVAVAMRALSRDREARYPGARELAQEVLAFQSGARVLAYEYSSWELLRRFVRRNPLLSLVSAVSVVLLLAATVVVYRARLEALDSLSDALQGRALDAEQDGRWADAAVYYAAARVHQDGSEARWGEKLSRTLAPLPVLRLPAKGLVRAAISGDGTRIATAGEGVIQIWDAKTGAMLSSEMSKGAVAALAFNGPLLAVAWGSAVSIGGREVPTGSEVHTFALSHDGALLAASGIDGGFRLFRASDGARLFAVPGARVAGLAFGDDDRHVYSSGWDGALRETDLSGKETMKVELSGSRLWGIAVKGQRVAVGNRSGVLRYWNEGLSAQPLVYAEASPGLAAVAFSPDGGILAAAGRGGRVHLRDAASGRLLVTFEGPPHPSSGLFFTPDGATLIVVTQDAGAQLWRLPMPRPQATLTGHKGHVRAVAFEPGGAWLASAGEDGTVRCWDAATGREIERSAAGATLHGLSVSPDGARIAWGDEQGGVWVAAPLALASARRISLDGGSATQVAFSPDGKRLASVHEDGALRVFDPVSGAVKVRPAGQDKLGCVAWSPDGALIATGGDDTTIRLWDAATLQQTAVFRGHPGRLRVLAFSADGKLLASGSNNRVGLVFRVADGSIAARLEGHEGPLRAIAFAPWGGALATGSVDHTVRIWELPSGTQVRKFARHDNQVTGLSWSSRGVLASSSSDGTIERLQLGNPADLPPPSRSFEEIQKRQWLRMVRFELQPAP